MTQQQVCTPLYAPVAALIAVVAPQVRVKVARLARTAHGATGLRASEHQKSAQKEHTGTQQERRVSKIAMLVLLVATAHTSALQYRWPAKLELTMIEPAHLHVQHVQTA